MRSGVAVLWVSWLPANQMEEVRWCPCPQRNTCRRVLSPEFVAGWWVLHPGGGGGPSTKAEFLSGVAVNKVALK